MDLPHSTQGILPYTLNGYSRWPQSCSAAVRELPHSLPSLTSFSSFVPSSFSNSKSRNLFPSPPLNLAQHLPPHPHLTIVIMKVFTTLTAGLLCLLASVAADTLPFTNGQKAACEKNLGKVSCCDHALKSIHSSNKCYDSTLRPPSTHTSNKGDSGHRLTSVQLVAKKFCPRISRAANRVREATFVQSGSWIMG